MSRSTQMFTISTDDIEILNDIKENYTSDSVIVKRANVLLLYNQGYMGVEIAKKLNLWPSTVNKYKKNYLEFGIDGIFDAPRSELPTECFEEFEILWDSHGDDWTTSQYVEKLKCSYSTVRRYIKQVKVDLPIEDKEDQFIENIKSINDSNEHKNKDTGYVIGATFYIKKDGKIITSTNNENNICDINDLDEITSFNNYYLMNWKKQLLLYVIVLDYVFLKI